MAQGVKQRYGPRFRVQLPKGMGSIKMDGYEEMTPDFPLRTIFSEFRAVFVVVFWFDICFCNLIEGRKKQKLWNHIVQL